MPLAVARPTSARAVYGDRSTVYAQVIADSISPEGVRLTTLEVQCHRFVLSEFNTHRVFSRNSASSRAIPVRKQLQYLRDAPAVPLSFPQEKAGMQGGDELDADLVEEARAEWLVARDAAIASAEKLVALGVHKSIVNRLLEPFMWHRIIVSSTRWDGFFAQRISPNAQPEINAVASRMHEALETSTPDDVEASTGWHTPYIDDVTDDHIREAVGSSEDAYWELRREISAARCARVSYLTHTGIRDIEADRELYQKLVSAEPPHWSPLEHVATPGAHPTTVSNFDGWTQLRQIAELARTHA